MTQTIRVYPVDVLEDIIKLAAASNELTAHIILGAISAMNKMYPQLVLEVSKRLTHDLLLLFQRHHSDPVVANVDFYQASWCLILSCRSSRIKKLEEFFCLSSHRI